MPSATPEKGDKVSWSWGGAQPGGEVSDKKTEGEVAVTSKRGNIIKKSAEPSDPAVAIARAGNDVVKKASEIEVEEKNAGGKGRKGGKRGKAVASAKEATTANEEVTEGNNKGTETNGEAKTGEKRAHEDDDADEEEAGQPARKGRGRAKGADTKTLPEPRTPGTGRKRGRPPGSGKKDRTPKEKVLGPDGKPRGRGRPRKSESNATPSEAKAEKKTPPPDTTPAMGTRRSTRNRG